MLKHSILVLQCYKQKQMLLLCSILSEMQKRNTLIPLYKRFIKYLYYRSQNKIRNTSIDGSLRKKTFLIILFSIHTIRPNMLLIVLFVFLICADMLSFAIYWTANVQDHLSSLNLFLNKICVLTLLIFGTFLYINCLLKTIDKNIFSVFCCRFQKILDQSEALLSE